MCSILLFSSVSAEFYDQYITAVKDAEIMQGYPDGEFKGNNPINRVEFVKTIITSMYNDESIEKCTSRILYFSDINDTAWYVPTLCIAYNESIINGYPDGTFRPDASISLAEASAVLTRTFDVQTAQTDLWYEGHIAALKKLGALPPTANKPDKPFLRKELAFSIAQLLKLHADGTLEQNTFLQASSIDPNIINTSELLNILNAERATQGLNPVQLDSTLNEVSKKYAKRMADEAFFSHTDKNGETTHERLINAGYNYRAYGENIGVGQSTEQEIMRWWIASPGHYENIVRPHFTHVGFGKIPVPADQTEYQSGSYWVNTFATPQ
jgi:uncharacterized protein YkwD